MGEGRKATMLKVRNIRRSYGTKVVFSDVRYPNEADAVRKLGGQVWRIERDGHGPANEHTSEHALNKYNFDQRIYNDKDLESLWAKVGVLCRELP
jgi:hypothetical protein